MSTDNVNNKKQKQQDITWDALVRESEVRIQAYRRQISDLRKSIIFFKKQESLGIPFPITKAKKVDKYLDTY